MPWESYFKPLLSLGISVFHPGVSDVEYKGLGDDEREAIERCISQHAKVLGRISPHLAEDWLAHKDFFFKVAEYAKAKLGGGEKSFSWPSKSGGLGVSPLIPQIIKYKATATSTYPCYTGYTTNSWEISLTAGTMAYLFGDGTNYYKPSPVTNEQCIIAIIQDGIVEIGTTPRIYSWRAYYEGRSEYGAWSTTPVVVESIEENRKIYQHVTPGAFVLPYAVGFMLGGMPSASGTAHIEVLGLAFYEHDFFKTPKYAT